MSEWFVRVMRSLGWMPTSEAVQAEAFETELLAIVGPAESERDEVRQMAIVAAKAGLVSAQELERLITVGMSSAITRVRDLEWARGKSGDEIERRQAEIWDEIR